MASVHMGGASGADSHLGLAPRGLVSRAWASLSGSRVHQE